MPRSHKSPAELGPLEHTDRGFEIILFLDRYNASCSLQQSSLATEAAIWLGVNQPAQQVGDCRMHLTRPHVHALVATLQRWLETESFAP